MCARQNKSGSLLPNREDTSKEVGALHQCSRVNKKNNVVLEGGIVTGNAVGLVLPRRRDVVLRHDVITNQPVADSDVQLRRDVAKLLKLVGAKADGVVTSTDVCGYPVVVRKKVKRSELKVCVVCNDFLLAFPRRASPSSVEGWLVRSSNLGDRWWG